MDMESSSKTSKSKNKKRPLIIVATGVLLIVLALAGNKWMGQIQEYKDSVYMYRQEIDELKARIKELETSNNTNVSTDRKLEMPNWNVEIPLREGSSQFSTTYDNGYYYIHSNVNGCHYDSMDVMDATNVVVAAISRNKTEEIITPDGFMGDHSWVGKSWGSFYESIKNGRWNANKVIDEYVYNISGPQMSCGNTETAAGKSASQMHQKLTEEAVSLFNGLRIRNK